MKNNTRSRIIKKIISPFYKVLYKVILEMIFGIELSPHTQIGDGLVLEHGGNGVIIHSASKIGNNVVIYQQVTIGGYGLSHFDKEYRDNNIAKSEGCPVIGNNVVIGAGAKILGNIKIGNNARIGANAVVLKDVPDGATAVGIPARIILN